MKGIRNKYRILQLNLRWFLTSVSNIWPHQHLCLSSLSIIYLWLQFGSKRVCSLYWRPFFKTLTKMSQTYERTYGEKVGLPSFFPEQVHVKEKWDLNTFRLISVIRNHCQNTYWTTLIIRQSCMNHFTCNFAFSLAMTILVTSSLSSSASSSLSIPVTSPLFSTFSSFSLYVCRYLR